MNRKSFTLFFTALLLVILTGVPCLAHKVRIFAWEEDGKIMTESKFSGGRAAKNVTVIVNESGSEKQLLTGKTDENGIFGFTPPATAATGLDIIIDGGDGHKNVWTHTLATAPQPAEPAQGATPAPTVDVKTEQVTEKATAGIAPQELETIIARQLDKQLAPIRKTLAEASDSGPTLQDILGGIGYIFGLAGIAAYFQARRMKEKS